MNEFVYVSGRHCLDFAGTMLWRRTLRTELLETPEDLRRWVQGAHLICQLEDPSTESVRNARNLREVIYSAVSAFLPESVHTLTAEERALLNRAAAWQPPALLLTVDGEATTSGSVENVFSLLARDAIELIGSRDISKVKECVNPDCSRMFVDLSRGSSRRWCGMAECGNRAKAADYRRRKKLQSTE